MVSAARLAAARRPGDGDKSKISFDEEPQGYRRSVRLINLASFAFTLPGPKHTVSPR